MPPSYRHRTTLSVMESVVPGGHWKIFAPRLLLLCVFGSEGFSMPLRFVWLRSDEFRCEAHYYKGFCPAEMLYLGANC
jgi:hypothetical protein